MKKREILWVKSKGTKFLRLIYFYEVGKSLTPREKRLIKKGMKR